MLAILDAARAIACSLWLACLLLVVRMLIEPSHASLGIARFKRNLMLLEVTPVSVGIAGRLRSVA